MYSSQSKEYDLIFSLYNDSRTVFKLNDIAMLTGETNFESLNKKLNYYAHSGKILNPRKGIYVKLNYNMEELACRIYIPSYISLEYVLQKSGIIFQYSSAITSISYLSRTIEINETTFVFRKMKGVIIADTSGIIRNDNGVNIATAERAFLDKLYLNPDYYFDNLNPLNKALIFKLLLIYNSKSLTQRVTSLLNKNGHK
jgi:hypothetical protein